MFNVNATDLDEVTVLLSSSGRPYFSSTKDLYGTKFKRVKLLYDKSSLGARQYWDLERSDWKLMDRPEHPCIEDSSRNVFRKLVPSY